MPLTPGSSDKTISNNISEFHTGPRYAHTAAKFGKARADKQAIAVAIHVAEDGQNGKRRQRQRSSK